MPENEANGLAVKADLSCFLTLVVIGLFLLKFSNCFQEAFDYIGSSRMVYNMQRGDFTFDLDDIEMFVEIGQIGLHKDVPDSNTVWTHTGLTKSDQV